jgi:hypothetical protein
MCSCFQVIIQASSREITEAQKVWFANKQTNKQQNDLDRVSTATVMLFVCLGLPTLHLFCHQYFFLNQNLTQTELENNN